MLSSSNCFKLGESAACDLLRAAESCKQAGSAILSVYNSAAIETHLKTDQSPVTNADLAAHRVLAEGLGGAFAGLSRCV